MMMRPESNQPAKLYGTAKTHKFEDLEDITPQNFKCCPIIDQTGTFTFKAAKVISNYLHHYVKTNTPSQIRNNFQICFQIHHRYWMMKSMFLMIQNLYLQTFLL